MATPLHGGDITKFIYRFRQADPQIHDKFKAYQEEGAKGC